MIGKKITIIGNKVQDVGYRLFLLDEAERMLVTHLDAKNLRKNTTQETQEKVEVLIGGDKDRVDKFVEFVKNNFPENADIDKPIGDAENYEGDIRTIESFSRCLSVHQLTKFAVIGTKIVTSQENLRKDTNDNFSKMDTKYDKISNAMFAIVNEIKDTNKLFENRIEKTEKTIEKLLEILVEQKK
jgi:acylphosphatase